MRLGFEQRRIHKMASSHRELKEYVEYITQHLQENERLFARLFALENRLLSASDPEDVCLALLRGLRLDFNLDMVRLWFDRDSFIGQYPFHGLTESDLVWVEKNEIYEVGLAHQRVRLVQLAKGEHFVWLEKQDAKLKSMALIILGDLARPYGVLGLGSLEGSRFNPEHGTDFLQHLAQVSGLMLENTVSRERLSRMILKDRTTGTHNPRFFQPYSHQMISQWFGRNIPVGCLCINVDGLHQQRAQEESDGDENGQQEVVADVLQSIANAIKPLLRYQDMLIRNGDEDFIVFLPGIRPIQDIEMAEAIMVTVSDVEYQQHQISLSIGLSLSTLDEDPTIVSLLRRTEKAMQRAVQHGGNRIECSTKGDSE